MKKAFTMIELIFVIVIIGILGGVAIPRLMMQKWQIVQKILRSLCEISLPIILHRGLML